MSSTTTYESQARARKAAKLCKVFYKQNATGGQLRQLDDEGWELATKIANQNQACPTFATPQPNDWDRNESTCVDCDRPIGTKDTYKGVHYFHWEHVSRAPKENSPSEQTKALVISVIEAKAELDRIEAQELIRQAAKDYAPAQIEVTDATAQLSDGNTAYFVAVHPFEPDNAHDVVLYVQVIEDECYFATVVNGRVYANRELEALTAEYAS